MDKWTDGRMNTAKRAWQNLSDECTAVPWDSPSNFFEIVNFLKSNRLDLYKECNKALNQKTQSFRSVVRSLIFLKSSCPRLLTI